MESFSEVNFDKENGYDESRYDRLYSQLEGKKNDRLIFSPDQTTSKEEGYLKYKERAQSNYKQRMSQEKSYEKQSK